MFPDTDWRKVGLLTRLKIITSFIVLAVVGVLAYQVFDPGPGVEERDRKRDREVYLRVEFDDYRSTPVIIYQIGSGNPESATPTRSAWDKTVMAAEGDLVVLNVSQKQAGGTRCIIVARDTVQSSRSMYGPGSIGCHYKVL